MRTRIRGRTLALIASLAALLSVLPARAQPGTLPAAPRPASAATQQPAAQVKCPVTPEEEIDPEIFTDYRGSRVYFCCERCKKKFEREPEKYSAQLVADQGAPQTPPDQPAAKPDVNGLDHPAAHEHGDSDHPDGAETPAAPTTGDAANVYEEHDGHEGHEHQHGDAGALRFLSWLGNFHPPMTSFPIGVLVAAAVAEFLFLRSKAPIFDQAARFGVWFASLMGVLAAFLGWCFGGFRLVDHDPILLTHRWLGTATALWMLALLWACERTHRLTPPGTPAPARRGRRLYLFMLFGGAALVLATGFFGGAMVYGLSHYWS